MSSSSDSDDDPDPSYALNNGSVHSLYYNDSEAEARRLRRSIASRKKLAPPSPPKNTTDGGESERVSGVGVGTATP